MKSADRPGRALGINGVFGSVGIAAAGLIAGGLIDLYGWRAAFFVPGAISLATGLALFVCLRLGLVFEGSARRAPPPASRGDMVRVFTILLVTMLAMGIIFQASQVAMPKLFDLRLRDLVGEGAFGVGALVALVYLAGSIMQVAVGYVADRYALKPIYLVSWLVQVPVLLGIGLLAGLPLLVLATMTVLLSAGALPAENLLLNRYSPEKHRGLAFGIKYVVAFGSAPLALQLVARMNAITGEFVWLFVSLAALAAVATVYETAMAAIDIEGLDHLVLTVRDIDRAGRAQRCRGPGPLALLPGSRRQSDRIGQSRAKEYPTWLTTLI